MSDDPVYKYHIDPLDTGNDWLPMCGFTPVVGNRWIVGSKVTHRCITLSTYLNPDEGLDLDEHHYCKDCLGNKHWDMYVLNITLKTV